MPAGKSCVHFLDAFRVSPRPCVGAVPRHPSSEGAFGWISGAPVREPAVLLDPGNQLLHTGLPHPVTVDAPTIQPTRDRFIQDVAYRRRQTAPPLA
jgi:hypothetical protein